MSARAPPASAAPVLLPSVSHALSLIECAARRPLPSGLGRKRHLALRPRQWPVLPAGGRRDSSHAELPCAAPVDTVTWAGLDREGAAHGVGVPRVVGPLRRGGADAAVLGGAAPPRQASGLPLRTGEGGAGTGVSRPRQPS